ncbi:hypothetical protein ETB97_006652 [Aspergillus alliaceus]|uniref:Uncharacterized protein n=1 Tax=Petromyces alliaceus TaxID=209559 RepID=A0A5N6FZ75_PETAA|nr:uncharacterized protein BDW43DRAFT_309222 [Aspergillus alliaceus]KAB8235351.1 hypothetical protein BDW43DRAFT_309222 [Aspergillus alliaceus]KAE8387546.1 hypothetical protein BDV23DRAFT_186212 [Aspergillus alliaceus]KAF5856865.1 hypothetical protein ETB97_006652 [Aspergillus burnettii]
MLLFNWLFKSSKETSAPKAHKPIWDPQTLTMQQPASPQVPTDRAGMEQSNVHENTEVSLRGGGGGSVCCGVYDLP